MTIPDNVIALSELSEQTGIGYQIFYGAVRRGLINSVKARRGKVQLWIIKDQALSDYLAKASTGGGDGAAPVTAPPAVEVPVLHRPAAPAPVVATPPLITLAKPVAPPPTTGAAKFQVVRLLLQEARAALTSRDIPTAEQKLTVVDVLLDDLTK